MLLVRWLKEAFQRTRPDLVPHSVQVFTNSFPSGHAALSAVTYLAMTGQRTAHQPTIEHERPLGGVQG
jgi:undecaprenyl-diphosphatase